jgi:hypothetical protein
MALDYLLEGNYPLVAEVLSRTVVALYQADIYQEPGIIEKLEWDPPRNLIPRDRMRKILKDVERDNKLKKKKKKAPTDGENSPGGAGR